MSLNCLPMLALGVDPVIAVAILGALLAGIGTEVFGIGWSLAMQEHVPDEMLSRAYSYDALGSFLAIPIGQLAFGPLGVAFGIQQSMLISGILYFAICLLTLRPARCGDLQRAPTSSAPLLRQRPDHGQVAVGRDTEVLLHGRVGQRCLVVVAAEQQVHRTAADLRHLVGGDCCPRAS